MAKIDNFKSFVRKNPKLITHVRNGTMSWQKFYEIYDIYGEDNKVWEEYINKTNTTMVRKNTNNNTNINNGFNFSNIIEMTKNIDTNRLQEGITSIQKAISLFGDMLIKDQHESNNYTPRPIYRKFDD